MGVVARLPLFQRVGRTALAGLGLGWLRAAALDERERWPLWLPVALGAGIGIYFAMPFEPSLRWAAFAATAGSAAIFGAAGTQQPLWRAIFSTLAAVAFGFALAKARTETVAAPVLPRQIGPMAIEGRIEQAELHGKGIRFVLGEIRAKRFTDATRPARVRISVRATTPLPPPGSWVHVTAVLMPPPSPAAPGAYDFGRAAYYLRLGGVGYSYGRPRPIAPLAAPGWRDRWICCSSRRSAHG